MKNSQYFIFVVVDAESKGHSYTYRNLNDFKGLSPFILTKNGVIKVKNKVMFDRETQDEYVFTGNAGSTTVNTSFSVSVHIDDRNDHMPVFTEKMYVTEILDSVKVGDPIFKAYASDGDIGK